MLLYIVDWICVASLFFSLAFSFFVFVCVPGWIVLFCFGGEVASSTNIKK